MSEVSLGQLAVMHKRTTPAHTSPRQRRGVRSARRVGEPHVDRREGLGLRHLEQMFAREFEQRDEGDDHHRDALRGVEQVLEQREAAALQAAQHDAHVLAHAQLFAVDRVVGDEPGALEDVVQRSAKRSC